jgi:hypothetical protein
MGFIVDTYAGTARVTGKTKFRGHLMVKHFTESGDRETETETETDTETHTPTEREREREIYI